MSTALYALVLLHEASFAVSIDDNVLVYSVFQHPDGLVDLDISPSTEAYTTKYPDLLCCAKGQLKYRYNSAIGQGVIRGFPVLADAGMEVYLVQPDDVFSRNTIGAGKFPIVLDYHHFTGHDQLLGEEFYLGIATGLALPPAPFITRTYFGWAHLKRINGLLTLIDQSLAVYSDGIIVGTRNAVPEPSTILLLLPVIMGLCLCSFRNTYFVGIRMSGRNSRPMARCLPGATRRGECFWRSKLCTQCLNRVF